jgi:hypothetical protein
MNEKGQCNKEDKKSHIFNLQKNVITATKEAFVYYNFEKETNE